MLLDSARSYSAKRLAIEAHTKDTMSPLLAIIGHGLCRRQVSLRRPVRPMRIEPAATPVHFPHSLQTLRRLQP
jgi:hypothetical protein